MLEDEVFHKIPQDLYPLFSFIFYFSFIIVIHIFLSYLFSTWLTNNPIYKKNSKKPNNASFSHFTTFISVWVLQWQLLHHSLFLLIPSLPNLPHQRYLFSCFHKSHSLFISYVPIFCFCICEWANYYSETDLWSCRAEKRELWANPFRNFHGFKVGAYLSLFWFCARRTSHRRTGFWLLIKGRRPL